MMDILRFLFLAFVSYLGYRLVFDFILPVYKTTKKVRKTFREMQQHIHTHAKESFQEQNDSTQNKNEKRSGGGEYIEFEEIKD